MVELAKAAKMGVLDPTHTLSEQQLNKVNAEGFAFFS